MLGIDSDNRLFYEGSPSLFGHGIWPSPFVSPAYLIQDDADYTRVLSTGYPARAEMVFREDAFDPVTRIRRGRLYESPLGNQRPDWQVQTHPALRVEINRGVGPGGLWRKPLDTYAPKRIDRTAKMSNGGILLALGSSDAFTLWTLLSVERLSTGDDLVTVRARSNFGVLPDLDVNSIPEAGRRSVVSQFEKAADAAHRQGPEAVVDRCRDAATAAIGLWLHEREPTKRWLEVDLGKLVRRLRDENKEVLSDAASIVARLHARAKPNAEHQFNARKPVETDAECSLALLGIIARELGWAA